MPSPATTVLAGVAVALAGNTATNAIDPPDAWRWWPWAVWTLVVLLVACSLWIEVARQRATAAEDPGDVVADLLAPVGNSWAAEAVRREVTRPAPILVRWSSTGRLAADRAAVLGDPLTGDWQEFPLRGETDAFNAGMVSAFRQLPRRQLVVLGEPGAGKSVFALLLTLGLIRAHTDGEPLPVLVPISGWDPAVPLDDFLADRLAEDQRAALSRHGDPAAVARRLVGQNRVLPVLDGLDELPVASIGEGMRVLDDYAAAGRPLVVTCRVREYERARQILTTAAVVELEPVGVEAAVAYLSYPERARSRWEPVFAHLRGAGREDPLVATLSTPLMVSLARTAYQEPGTDPTELLRLHDGPQIAGRLMSAFVAAAHPGTRQHRWLSCLAYQLYSAGTRDWHRRDLDPGLLAARPDRARRMVVIEAAAVAGLAGGVLAARAGLSVRWAVVAAVLVVTAASSGRLRVMLLTGGGVAVPHRLVRFAYGVAGGLLTGFITLSWTAALLAGLVCGWLARYRLAWPAGGGSAVLHAAVGGGVFAAGAAVTGGPATAVGVTAALLYGSAEGLAAGGWHVVRYWITRLHLAAQGRLPWRLRRFLADAHRRGVLRRAGAVYQFRHALLQDHFARPVHDEVLRAREAAGYLQDSGALQQEKLLEAVRSEIGRGSLTFLRVAQIMNTLMSEEELAARATRGDQRAARRLAALLAIRGDADGLRHRADRGDEQAAVRLAGLLGRDGDVEALRARASRGESASAVELADLHLVAGRADEAITVLEQFPGDRPARRRLAGILDQRGHTERALGILRELADTGDGLAGRQLAELLLHRGRISELGARADAGDGFAREQWARHLFDRGRIAELRRRADAGEPHAAARLADLLAVRGEVGELRDRWLAGDAAATIRLAELRADQGDLDTAAGMLRSRAGDYDGAAARRLARLLAEAGDTDEAVNVLRVRNDPESLHQLADLLQARRALAEASAVLRALAEDGDAHALARLAGIAGADHA